MNLCVILSNFPIVLCHFDIKNSHKTKNDTHL